MRSAPLHSYHPSAGTRQRAWLYASRHIGLAATSSDLALKQFDGGLGCFHQGGMNPQRASISTSPPLPPRSTGTLIVGATLKRLGNGLPALRAICQARSMDAVSGL